MTPKAPDSAARIKELEELVDYWIADRNELQQKDDVVIDKYLDRIKELEIESTAASAEARYWGKRWKDANVTAKIELDARNAEIDAIKEKLRVAREFISMLPETLIAEQPEWDCSENNGVIWKTYLNRVCGEALATIGEEA